MGQEISPLVIDLSAAENGGWPLLEAVRSATMQVTEGVTQRFPAVPQGPWSDPPNTAVVAAIPSNKAHEPAGVMIAGVSARLRLDQYYRDFFDLVRSQIAAAIANARAYEAERKRAEVLTELDRAKTAFFSNVSHEFRTPLTLMLGRSRTSSPNPRTGAPREPRGAQRRPPERAPLAEAREHAARLLPHRGRPHAGRSSRPTSRASPRPGERLPLRNRAGRAPARGGRPPRRPVYVDRDMWEKIVLNLMSNAFKFTFYGRSRSRCADRRPRRTAVRDTGTGIAAEEPPTCSSASTACMARAVERTRAPASGWRWFTNP